MLPTAAARTLTTPELLELILSQLSDRDLLLAQRVCRTWHTLISSSPTLQTTLYFRAPHSTIASDQYTLNPFITSAFPFLLTPDRPLSDEEVDYLDRKFSQTTPPVALGTMTDAPEPFQYSAWVRNEEAWKRKEASWRKMYVANPPVTRVVFMQGGCGMAGQWVSEAVVEFGSGRTGEEGAERGWLKHGDHRVDVEHEGGLRMGVLYDYTYHCCTEQELNVSMEFFTAYVDEWDDISNAVEAQRYWQRRGKRGGAVATHGEHGTEVMGGLTLVVDTTSSDTGCCDDDQVVKNYGKFRSEGHRDVEAGPLRTAHSGPWD